MMFIGYTEQESDSVHMWDPSTMRVAVMGDFIWLKKLHFQPDDIAGVLELYTIEGIDDSSKSTTQANDFKNVKLGGNITWSNPVVMEPTHNLVTRLGQGIKPPDRLMYTPVVELKYLGEMADLE